MTDEPKRQHIIYDRDGNPVGPFDSTADAITFVKRQFPNETQDANNIGQGGDGWNLAALCAPEDYPAQ